MRQELLDFSLACFARMLLAREQNEPADPPDTGILGTDGMMQNPQMLRNLVERYRFGDLGRHFVRCRIHIGIKSSKP
jgi:hypothetical protein